MSKNKSLLKDIKLNWWQAGLFKTAAVSFGIILGIYFSELLSGYLFLFWLLFIVPGIYIFYTWFKQ